MRKRFNLTEATASGRELACSTLLLRQFAPPATHGCLMWPGMRFDDFLPSALLHSS